MRVAILTAVILAVVVGVPIAAETADKNDKTNVLAKQILEKTGVRGGLIVHLGCGDGKLTAALGGNRRYLVHGLDTDAGKVRRARGHIQSLGLYGRVSVDSFDGRQLPYVDDLVNLLVAGDLGAVSLVVVEEPRRPGGAAKRPHQILLGQRPLRLPPLSNQLGRP